MEPNELLARTRRAYEWGRLRRAARVTPLVLALVASSAYGCGRPSLSLAVGGALVIAAVALGWRGQRWGAAVLPGLGAGAIPLGLLLLLKIGALRFCTVEGCMTDCVRLCWLGGVAAGLVIAWRSRRIEEDVGTFLLAGSIVAGLTGLLGCLAGGVVGMAGMLVGELVATAPALVYQLRRS